MARRVRGLRWYIGGLLFLSTVINYIDRQTLSVLAPLLKTDLRLDQLRLRPDPHRVPRGLRLRPDAGRARHRSPRHAQRASRLGVAWYSVAAMATSLASGLGWFMGARFALGLGEAANWPGATKAVSEWFPRRESGWAVALFDSGSSVGAAIAPWLVLSLYAAFGSWRPAFIVTGALGFVWLALFLALYRRPEEHPLITDEEREMLRRDKEVDAAEHADGRRAAVRDPAAAAADLGLHPVEDLHRPGVVLHHRLVRHLPGEPRLQHRGGPARLLGAVPGGRCRQLLRRGRLELADRPRLVGERRRARRSA